MGFQPFFSMYPQIQNENPKSLQNSNKNHNKVQKFQPPPPQIENRCSMSIIPRWRGFKASIASIKVYRENTEIVYSSGSQPGGNYPFGG